MNPDWPDQESLKKSMIAYLVHYYRYRPRLQKPVVKLDVQTQDGITADGLLEFPTEKQGLFTVAFEVTEATAAQELYYVLHQKLLAKDALIFALLLASLLFAGFAWYRPELIIKMGVAGGAITYLGTVIVLTTLSIVLGYQLSHYRWIPALEQFKAYHAEEQWVAVGEGVFDNVRQTQWLELRKQCLLNGFGLVKFTHDFQQTTYLTPARQERFYGKRKRSYFFERTNPAIVPTWNVTSKFLPKELRLLRHQWAMMAGVVALCTFVFVQLRHSKPEVTITEMPWLQDSLLALQNRAIPEEETTDLETFKNIDVVEKPEIKPRPKQKDPSTKLPSPVTSRDILTPRGGGQEECQLPFKGNGPRYYVQEGIYSNKQMAHERTKVLSKKGVPAHILSSACLGGMDGKFVVYLGDFMDSEANARSWKQLISQQLQSANLLQEDPVLKKFQAH